jgi:hypothetical protein
LGRAPRLVEARDDEISAEIESEEEELVAA